MITCPVCLTSNVDNTFFCHECGHYLLEDGKGRETELYDLRIISGLNAPSSEPEKTADAATGPVGVCLEIRDKCQAIDMPDHKGVCLGRLDPSAGIFPEIDLTELGSEGKSVSRRHAMLLSEDNRLIIEDLGSANGTYLNGKRLNPYAREPVEDGDILHLGKLEVLVRIL